MKQYSIFDTIAPISDYYNDQYINTFTNLATLNIGAYSDSQSNQSLTIGASSNLNIEAANFANIYTSNGLYLYHTEIDNNIRNDTQLLNINGTDTNTTLSTLNDLSFSFSNNVNFGTFYINSSPDNVNNDILFTEKNCVRIDSLAQFSCNAMFNSNIYVNGSIFGNNLNVWANRTATLATDVEKIGYGFQVNSNNELELVKVVSLGNKNIISKKIALFGHGILDHNSTDDASYLVFNNINGVSVSDGGNVSGNRLVDDPTLTSSSDGASIKAVNNVYNMEISLSNYVYSSNYDMKGRNVLNCGSITSAGAIVSGTSALSNVTASNITTSGTGSFMHIVASKTITARDASFSNVAASNLTIGVTEVIDSSKNVNVASVTASGAGSFASVTSSGAVTAVGAVVSGTSTLSNVTASNITISGTCTFGNVESTGSGSFAGVTLTGNSNLLPTTTINNDIGSAGLQFANVYSSVVSTSNLWINGIQYITSNRNIATNLTPSNNNSYNIGSPTALWKNLYLSSNVIAAGAISGTGANISGTSTLSNVTASNITISSTITATGANVTASNITVVNAVVSGISTLSNVTASNITIGTGTFTNIIASTLKMGTTQVMDSSGNISAGTVTTTGNVIAKWDAKYTWVGDTTTGMLKPATGVIGLMCVGTTRLTIDSTNCTVNANIIPTATNTNNIGSGALQFASTYTSNVWTSNVYVNGTNIIDADRNITNVNNVTASNITISGTGSFANVTASNITASNVTANEVITAGSDFAEYMPKAVATDVFIAGDLVGIDSSGRLTKVYSEANHFMVISDNAGIIGGGDSLSNESEIVGFCGRIKVNCEANVGQYIVPVASEQGEIIPRAFDKDKITFEQYMQCVGHVISIIPESNLPLMIIKSV